MRAFTLKAGLAAAVLSVSTMGAFAAPSVNLLQTEALENHGLVVDQSQMPVNGKIFQKSQTNGSRYDKLEREAWQNHQ